MAKATSRFTPWWLLLVPPVSLAACFAPLAAFLVFVRGVHADALQDAITPLAPYPVTLAYVLVILVVRRVAARDGRTLEDLGLRLPDATDLFVAIAAAFVSVLVNVLWAYPLVQRAQPSFDPTLAVLPLPAALVMMTVSALGEDVVFRGYSFLRFEAAYGRVVAVLVTSLAYAVLAPGPEWPLKLWALGFGLCLGLLRLVRGNLWVVVIVHVATALAPKVIAAAS